jgi:hypothetical protein
MLVQTIVLSRCIEHPLQICCIHVSDVVLGPSGYPIIDEGWKRAVGLVGKPATELIIITIIIITMGSIISSSNSIVAITFGIIIMIVDTS